MSIKKGKRAQPDATNAATLVALIGALIILYILFLPPGERAKLLGENKTSANGENGGDEKNITLLEEKPGRLEKLPRDEYEHDLPAFTLFKTTNSQELLKINSFYIRNSWFDEKKKELSFKIDDLSNTGNVFLTFTATKRSGVLTIKLNDNVVFESEITTANIEPITFPRSLLKSENSLEFSVSDSGWAFWKANSYSLENVRIIGDITDISKQESKNVFILSSTEANNLDTTKLQFNPECKPSQVGLLEIMINYNVVFSGVPDCGILNKVEFSPDILKTGQNQVIFKTEMGSYLIDRIQVQTKLKEKRFPVYYFDLNDERYDDVISGDRDLLLSLKFPDDGEDRSATFIVNGRKFYVDTDEKGFSRNLCPSSNNCYAVHGNNYIKIEPEETMDIVELKVTLG